MLSLWECGLSVGYGLCRSGISVGVISMRYSLGGDVVFCGCVVSVGCGLCGVLSLSDAIYVRCWSL